MKIVSKCNRIKRRIIRAYLVAIDGPCSYYMMGDKTVYRLQDYILLCYEICEENIRLWNYACTRYLK